MSQGMSINFWQWLILGNGDKPGYRRVINRWLCLHISVGAVLACLVPEDLQSTANTVLLPLVGILIGLCFAWAGNAQALLQAEEIVELTKYHKGGFAEYVFTYQLAILAILITLVAWALAGFGIFDKTWPTSNQVGLYCFIKFALFTLSSITLRECWHVVLGAQWMLLAQHTIKHAKKEKKE